LDLIDRVLSWDVPCLPVVADSAYQPEHESLG
jgi:hypothetical protein